MADERTAEPPPGTPGQRALGAMESAVRRARESAGAPRSPLPPPPEDPAPHRVDGPPVRAPTSAARRPGGGRPAGPTAG